MPKFLVKDRTACWVTWTYEIEAADADEASARYFNGEYTSYVGDPEIGDCCESYESEVTVTESKEPV